MNNTANTNEHTAFDRLSSSTCLTNIGTAKKTSQIKTLFLSIFILPFLYSNHLLAQNTESAIYKQPQIPSDFRSKIEEYLFFDNNFNVIQRLRSEEKIKANLMSADDKKPVSVLIFEADYEKIRKVTFVSKFIENSDLSKIKTADNRIFIPCLESDIISTNVLKLKFGSPVYKTLGRKALSRATYYIDPIGPTGGFFAKFVPHIPGLEQKLKREILVNDYVKSQISYLPTEIQNLSMDSFMALNLNLLGIPISVAYRSADRVTADKGQNIKTFPGHGLLGCDECVRDYAIKKTGLTDPDKAIDRWKTTELIPKLAKYMAYANHILGVSFESHTQNMIFDINTMTGEIKNIYFRDFADVLLNPIPLLAEGRLPTEIQWNRVKLMSVHGNYFSDQGVSIAKDIWYHSSIYSGQGITSHITGFQRQQRHLKIFLNEYIKHTEIILGASITLSDDAKKVLSQLEDKTPKAEFYSGELQERSPLRNAMASILKPIFEQVYKIKTEKIENDLKNALTTGDQKTLSKAFYKLLLSQRVVFMGDSEKNRLTGFDTKYTWLKNTLNAYFKLGLSSKKIDSDIEFKIFEDRIWAVDKISQKPLAATIEKYVAKSSFLETVKSLFDFRKIQNLQNISQCKNLF